MYIIVRKVLITANFFFIEEKLQRQSKRNGFIFASPGYMMLSMTSFSLFFDQQSNVSGQRAHFSIGHATKSLTPPLDLVISEANFILKHNYYKLRVLHALLLFLFSPHCCNSCCCTMDNIIRVLYCSWFHYCAFFSLQNNTEVYKRDVTCKGYCIQTTPSPLVHIGACTLLLQLFRPSPCGFAARLPGNNGCFRHSTRPVCGELC